MPPKIFGKPAKPEQGFVTRLYEQPAYRDLITQLETACQIPGLDQPRIQLTSAENAMAVVVIKLWSDVIFNSPEDQTPTTLLSYLSAHDQFVLADNGDYLPAAIIFDKWKRVFVVRVGKNGWTFDRLRTRVLEMPENTLTVANAITLQFAAALRNDNFRVGKDEVRKNPPLASWRTYILSTASFSFRQNVFEKLPRDTQIKINGIPCIFKSVNSIHRPQVIYVEINGNSQSFDIGGINIEIPV
ncbi:MAG: hypothetical protein AAB874_06820 [Patescibacteria group bacterium]